MKSKDLIAELLKQDPTGEAEVVIGGQDIWCLQKCAMYYDGTPHLLKRDPNDSENVIGYSVRRGYEHGKIELKLKDMDAFIADTVEIFDKENNWDNPKHIDQLKSDILSKMDWDSPHGKESLERDIDVAIKVWRMVYSGGLHSKMRKGNDFP